MAVNVMEISRVRPATDSHSSGDSVDPLSLPLTFFDLPWLRLLPSQRLIFYRVTESTHEFFHSDILPKLKLSLSIVLRRYLLLTGRIVWDPQELKPSIVVSGNDAVQLSVAETDADLYRLSGDGQRLATELHPLVPVLAASDDSASILSLQITLFPGQGFCIGVTAHHAVLDGKTASMFIKAWAHICNKLQHGQEKEVFASLPENLTPCFDRSALKHMDGLEAKMMDLLSSFRKNKSEIRSLKLLPAGEIHVELVLVTLQLTREDVQKLRERVKNESTAHQGLHLSTFVLAYAYIWTCMVKARVGDVDRPVAFLFSVDFRHRLDPPLPETYFGNCTSPLGCYDRTARTFMEEEGFVTAVKILSDLVDGLGPRTIEAGVEAVAKSANAVRSGAQLGSVSGSNWFGLYGSDFGWGKPEKVEVFSIYKSQSTSMSERRDESGGVEIGICLKKSEMDILVPIFNDGLK